MRDIHLSQAARSDLVDIWAETYRQWGAAQADRYLDDIDRALQGLIANPQMGSDCSDLLQGARKLITGRHLVFYEVDPDRIFVIRILHQSMDVPRHLRPS
jgi:toxin ParE1/3/4